MGRDAPKIPLSRLCRQTIPLYKGCKFGAVQEDPLCPLIIVILSVVEGSPNIVMRNKGSLCFPKTSLLQIGFRHRRWCGVLLLGHTLKKQFGGKAVFYKKTKKVPKTPQYPLTMQNGKEYYIYRHHRGVEQSGQLVGPITRRSRGSNPAPATI